MVENNEKPIKEGQTFEVRYPFVKEVIQVPHFNPDGIPSEHTESWRPGVLMEDTKPYGQPEAYAHAEGEMILEVVSTHKPGRFRERVFFIRQWRDPDGKTFGQTRLRMTTVGAFRNMTRGYRYRYDIEALANG